MYIYIYIYIYMYIYIYIYIYIYEFSAVSRYVHLIMNNLCNKIWF